MKLVLRILLISLLGFLVLREMLPIELNYYQSDYELRHESRINNQAPKPLFTAVDESGKEILVGVGQTSVLDSVPTEADLPSIPKVSFFNMLTTQNLASVPDDHIKVELDIEAPSLSWKRFIPIVKQNIKCQSKASFNWAYQYPNAEQSVEIKSKGTINLDGEFNFYGLCSGQEVKYKINKNIDKRIQELVVKDIKAKLANFKFKTNVGIGTKPVSAN